MKYPLQDRSLHVRNFKCFSDTAAGWQRFEPINLVVGRNNSGKSALIDIIILAQSSGASFDVARHGRNGEGFTLIASETIEESAIERVFSRNTSGGDIGMNHWQFGKHFIGARILREMGTDQIPKITKIYNEREMPPSFKNNLSHAIGWYFKSLKIIRVAAERDISPELRNVDLRISSNGAGITNIVRAFITSDKLPTEKVTLELLNDLNRIYLGDSSFKSIAVQENDDGVFEIFLEEEGKGRIRLSESGSSLKTIFIILTHLKLVDASSKKIFWDMVVFAIEEPENNLHPALLRRLLEYLSDQRASMGLTLIVTSHSPVCIDWCARREDAQIIHVSHDGHKSSTDVSVGYKQNRGILDDLDVRASDILQANGIIWVEGPSDRIYINHWIELITDGNIKEGLHYRVMFYAGKLLYHLNALPPTDASTLISLLSLNRNIALLMDSDRHIGTIKSQKPRINLNRTKRRIRDECLAMGSFVWITEGREVENYLSSRSLSVLSGREVAPGIYDKVPEMYYLKKFNGDKVELSLAYSRIANAKDLGTLDLAARLNDLVLHIKAWNKM